MMLQCWSLTVSETTFLIKPHMLQEDGGVNSTLGRSFQQGRSEGRSQSKKISLYWDLQMDITKYQEIKANLGKEREEQYQHVYLQFKPMLLTKLLMFCGPIYVSVFLAFYKKQFLSFLFFFLSEELIFKFCLYYKHIPFCQTVTYKLCWNGWEWETVSFSSSTHPPLYHWTCSKMDFEWKSTLF